MSLSVGTDQAVHIARQIAASGRVDDAAAQWLADGLRRWMDAKGDADMLLRCLRLPTTPKAWARHDRDLWLCRAGALIDEPALPRRAARLAELARRFERDKWLIYREQPRCPAFFDELDQCLFAARRAHRFPDSARQYQNILSGNFSAK